MILRDSFSLRMVAVVIAAFQIATAGAALAEAPPKPATLSQKPPSAEKTYIVLARARAAMKAGQFATAYADYRRALSLTGRGGPEHDEALRGISESGVKFAQQRFG